jgi:hypothetical protein
MGYRIQTIQASLAIEGNTLTCEQVTALLDKKRVKGSTGLLADERHPLLGFIAFNPTFCAAFPGPSTQNLFKVASSAEIQ